MNVKIQEEILKLDGRIVIPGDMIIKSESLEGIIVGDGIKVRDNALYAVKYGILKVKEDNTSEKIHVFVDSPHDVIIPRKGDVVLGKIINVGNTVATLKILFIVKKDERTGHWKLYNVPTPYQGLIHISYVGRPKHRSKKIPLGKNDKKQRQDYLFNYLAIGDIVLGEIIIDYTVPYGVMLKDIYYGVVAAKCTRCGTPLVLKNYKGEMTLFCPTCKKSDPRKFSVFYDYELFSTLFKIYQSRKYAYTPESEW